MRPTQGFPGRKEIKAQASAAEPPWFPSRPQSWHPAAGLAPADTAPRHHHHHHRPLSPAPLHAHTQRTPGTTHRCPRSSRCSPSFQRRDPTWRPLPHGGGGGHSSPSPSPTRARQARRGRGGRSSIRNPRRTGRGRRPAATRSPPPATRRRPRSRRRRRRPPARPPPPQPNRATTIGRSGCPAGACQRRDPIDRRRRSKLQETT